MLSTLGACKSRPDTCVREYALRFVGPPHPDANMLRQMVQRIRGIGRLTPTAFVISRRPRTAARKDDIIVAVKQEPWKSLRAMARERRLTINVIHTTTRVCLFPDDRHV